MSSRIEPRRRAEKPKRKASRPAKPPREPREPHEPRERREPPAAGSRPTPPAPPAPPARPAREASLTRRLGRITSFTLWLLVSLTGVGMLAVSLADLGPTWLPSAGAVIVGTSYTWALCARTGGRPFVYGLVALAFGGAAVGLDRDFLRSGAAAGTAIVSGVLAVLATVPAAKFSSVVREVLIAVAISCGGALAVVGFELKVSLERFEYTSLTLGVVLALAVVYRLGAGWHGLGRRGLVIVVLGSVLLGLTLVYAETLRHYGSPGVVDAIDDASRWTRTNLGGTPRPLQFVLGIPALAWGVHMRARRRQGWWVCAFGTVATVSIAGTLVRPHETLLAAGLGEVYTLAVGLLIGYVVIRLDLAFTGPRGSRARRAEEARAIRPEPRRTSPLL